MSRTIVVRKHVSQPPGIETFDGWTEFHARLRYKATVREPQTDGTRVELKLLTDDFDSQLRKVQRTLTEKSPTRWQAFWRQVLAKIAGLMKRAA